MNPPAANVHQIRQPMSHEWSIKDILYSN